MTAYHLYVRFSAFICFAYALSSSAAACMITSASTSMSVCGYGVVYVPIADDCDCIACMTINLSLVGTILLMMCLMTACSAGRPCFSAHCHFSACACIKAVACTSYDSPSHVHCASSSSIACLTVLFRRTVRSNLRHRYAYC